MNNSGRFFDVGKLPIDPVQFGYEDCECGHSFGPAVREYWLVHFVVSGTGIYRNGERTYSLRKGDMFTIAPREETFYKADDKDPWSYIWIGFSSMCDNDIANVFSEKMRCPDAERIFLSMKRADEMISGRNIFLCGKILELMSLIIESKSDKKLDASYVDRAVEMIRTEYTNDLTVEKMASRLNLDRSYFSVIFKRKIGVSPKQYLLSHRMNTAAMLLRDRGISVTVTANSVGYSDVYIFSKMFKRYFGVSPTEYAKNKGMQ